MRREELFAVADRQQGYFTAQQAVACNIPDSNFHRRLASGEWIKEQRGIYRLSQYPSTDRPELVIWSLWSRNRKGEPQGVWSHETALDIHELSDVMPDKMHMTVPKGFRRRNPIPPLLRLHRQDLNDRDVEQRQGYRVTTPLKTLIDVVSAGTVFDSFIAQGLHEALERGLISRRQIRESGNAPSIIKLRKMLE